MTTDTHNEIRSDLWHTMSVSELDDQLSLVYSKINTLHSLGVRGASPSHMMMLSALNHAKDALLALLNSKR